MKRTRLLFLLSLMLSLGLMTQCEKYEISMLKDDDSTSYLKKGKPDGKGNPNGKGGGNTEPGTIRGEDFGDLYVLLREPFNGMPVMLPVNGEWFVQPIDATKFLIPSDAFDDDNVIVLDQYGEVPEGAEVLEVDFGRLNIVRSPPAILDAAFLEAMKVLVPDPPPEGIEDEHYLYLDFCGRLVSHYYNEEAGENGEWVDKTIDSPRENMAIYRAIMTDFDNASLDFLNDLEEVDPLMIAASCFAAGSDKTGTVDIDEVVYINGIMDLTGNNPIPNQHDKDYYNFNDPDDTGTAFNYSRINTFGERYIQFLVWDNIYFPVDENGDSEGPVHSIWEIFEGQVDYKGEGVQPEFTYTDAMLTNSGVQGFAKAVDDAVQVLDFVHGYSNVRFLPDYEP